MQNKYNYKEKLPLRKEIRISWEASSACILQKVAVCAHTIVFRVFNSLLIVSLYLCKKLSLYVCIKLQSGGFFSVRQLIF